MTADSRRGSGHRGQDRRSVRALRARLQLLLPAWIAALSLVALAVGPVVARAASEGAPGNRFLATSERGVAQAGNAATWGNRRFRWYNQLLNEPARSPQATIWGIVPLWEAVDEDALADPSPANLSLVRHFAGKAETYWDRNVTPAPGVRKRTPAYAPYPGSHKDAKTFFDDDAWFALAFMDAHQVMVKTKNPRLAARYLHDAARGFNFILGNGWDHRAGGMWWNTHHVIRGGLGRSGEALGAATNLAARLYQATHRRVYLEAALKYITWANHHLLKWDGSYADRIRHEVTMPHDGEGAMIAAFTALCQANTGVPHTAYAHLPHNKRRGRNASFRIPQRPGSWCSWAEALARHTAFGVNPGGGRRDAYFPLREGPQWDAIYLRGLLALYGYDHDRTWIRRAERTSRRILSHARRSGGLFLNTWGGSTNVPGASPGEIRTHSASVSVFAALAAAGAR
jgi:hypothetical protein